MGKVIVNSIEFQFICNSYENKPSGGNPDYPEAHFALSIQWKWTSNLDK